MISWYKLLQKFDIVGENSHSHIKKQGDANNSPNIEINMP